jgi:bifunctional oligoribonuclease and PAP phosphatase NrnA
MNNDKHAEIRHSFIMRSGFIVSHIRPDGDAIGSVLALGLSLRELGKQVEMVLADGVPKNFRHLKGSDLISNRPHGEHDLSIVLIVPT